MADGNEIRGVVHMDRSAASLVYQLAAETLAMHLIL